MSRVPKERYFSRAYMDAEHSRMWRRVWQLGCHVGELSAPGDFRVVDLGRESVLLVRDAGGVRAFHNVCRHRGNRLCAAPCGRAESLRCSYHHWTWNLDGSIKRISRPEQFPGLDPDSVHLSPVRSATRLGFVWFTLDDGAPELDEYLGQVAAPIAAYRPEEYALAVDQTVEIACNWKLSADVSNEYYHLRTLHAEMMQVLDDTKVTHTSFGHHGRIVVPLGTPSRRSPFEGKVTEMIRGLLAREGVDPASCATVEEARRALVAAAASRARRDGIELGALSEEQAVDKHQFHLFPNVQLNFTLRTLELYRHRPHPSDPEIMFFDEQSYQRRRPGSPAHAPERRAFKHGERPLGPVMGQDVDLLPNLQRGMRSSGFDGLLLGEQEGPIAQMHRALDDYLAGAG